MQAKIVVVGDVAVGKSSVSVRYASDQYSDKLESTLGAAYLQKIQFVNGKQIKLKIWDTAGQEKYRSIAKIYYKDSQVAILIYDVTRKKTFQSLQMWAQQLKKNAPTNTIYFVVGNKVDLISCVYSQIPQQQITRSQQGRQFAKSIGASFFQVSAKSKLGINQLFYQIAENVMQIIKKSTLSTKESNLKNSSKITKNQPVKRKCCEQG